MQNSSPLASASVNPRGLGRETLGACVTAIIVIVLSFFFIDRPLSIALRALPSPVVDVFRAITDLAKAEVWIVASFLGALGLWLRARNQPDNAQAKRWFRIALFIFGALVISGIATDILKLLLCRARPVELLTENVYGFFPLHHREARFESMPSGHADTAMVLALLVQRLWPRYVRPAFICAGLLILSRLIVEAHYFGDVVAGGFVGWLTTRLFIVVSERRGWFSGI